MTKINIQDLKAVSLASSKDTTRRYLNGVFVEVYKDNTAGLIATNGHILHTTNIQPPENIISSGIVPSKMVQDIIKLINKTTVEIDIEILPAGNKWSDKINVSFDSHNLNCNLIDGNFPDWRGFLPENKPTNEPMAIAYEYLESTAKVAKAYKVSCVQFTSVGSGQFTFKVLNTPHFYGLIMGMNWDKINTKK
tara:strand:+ start:133 stop:711 length:579 start_codon:yes stop_codon:yes gene_type:complete